MRSLRSAALALLLLGPACGGQGQTQTQHGSAAPGSPSRTGKAAAPADAADATVRPWAPRIVSPDTAALAPGDRERVREIRRLMARLEREDRFSGVVLLAKGDSVLFQEAYGLTRRPDGEPIRVDTRFRLESMTKMLTAVAVAQLVERGTLAFEDPISKYVPGFRNREAVRKVRIEHLLSHTSGIPDYLRKWRELQPHDSVFRSVDDYVRFVELAQGDSLAFEPGTGWAYSNTNFILLGKIIEEATGRSYYDYVREHVFRPAGITGIDFLEPGPMPRNLAHGCRSEDGRLTCGRVDRTGMGSPEGGAYGTAGEVLRFALALRSGALLRPETVALVLSAKPHLGAPEWGYGFAVDPAHRVAGHGGTGWGTSTSLDMFLGAGYTAVILSNYRGARTPPREKIRELVLGRR